MGFRVQVFRVVFDGSWFLMKVVFDENGFDEIDHFHPNFDESVPNRYPLHLVTTGRFPP